MAARSASLRGTLSSAKILDVAIAFADTHGLGALSMRQLATEMGVSAMALYKHIADAESLIDQMVDAVIREYQPAPEHLTWREEVHARVDEARAALHRHRWMRRALETRTRRTAAVLSHMNDVTGAFLRGGLDPDLVHHLMHALGNRIWGFSPELFNDPESANEAPAPGIDLAATGLTHIVTITAAATAASADPSAGCDEDFEFRFSVDLILDAAERLHASGWTRPNGP